MLELVLLIELRNPSTRLSPRLRAYVQRTRLHLFDLVAQRTFGASVLL